MIYLATIEVITTPYMNDSEYETLTRIVVADDEADARAKIEKAIANHDPYGTFVQVEHIDLSPAIGMEL